MNLKQLIFIIQLVLIINYTQCYAKDRHEFSMPNVSKSNQKISNGNLLKDFYNIRGISNCSYENTINITNSAVLANGSYIYDSQTLVPPQLVGNYDYELLYNGSRRKVPLHKRACICHLKPCITLCSNDIPKTYHYIINNDIIDFVEVFYIQMSLTNSSVVTKNIVEDFEPIVLKEFCAASYMLSPEEDTRLSWTLFENGTLLRSSDQAQLKRTEYCFDLHRATIGKDEYDLINPRVCAATISSLPPLAKFNYCVQVFSLILLIFIMIAYCCLPELLTLQGKCFLTYVISSALYFAFFSSINLSQIKLDTLSCAMMAYLNHYILLSHYTWLGIMCYNNWIELCKLRNFYLYSTYAIFGFPLPLLITLLAAVARNLDIHESLKPLISIYRCTLEVNKWAVSIYLFGPCLIILVYCFVTFILTLRRVIAATKMNNEQNEATNEFRKALCYFYFQFVMLILFWFFDVLSFIFNLLDSPAVVDYVAAIQALFIYVYFISLPKFRNVCQKKTSGELKVASLETDI
ncbi:probable G-protein coupled receptor Mth-like 11 [Calliphora vicina]|uniref:probable G-protein coupled receptor Mth-like 11 n=1 Tax=Calliphora vicina TaxID=7373 RepID=UPI00325B37B3